MREIEESRDFKHDKRRIDRSGRYRRVLKERLAHALFCLVNDIPLDYSYHDHALIGKRLGYRECHLSFDLVLVYKLSDDDVLLLDNLGSHSEVLGL
ncbi:MAG: type II toxin-antitoxin system mRNA interferase toxin, RelE/StbE family [Synergistaceae bacterium]|nr:type II toxin-antitoxin system mRNA interferase toxin, RelE/StbE family [Synergistaceae bacterium]